MESKNIEIKEIEILTYSLRQINDIWRRYSVCDGSALWNYNFVKRMRLESWKAENEIRGLYLNYPPKRLVTILSELCFEINENIRIYREKEKDYNEYDFSKSSFTEYRQNWYKSIYEHSIWVLDKMLSKYLNKNTNTEIKDFPPLPDCFIDKQYFLDLLKIPIVEDLYTVSQDGSYHLKDRKKAYLGALAQRLYNTSKLKDFIKTNQDLAKIFCPFFNVRFNPINEKSFQANRSEYYDFDFIK